MTFVFFNIQESSVKSSNFIDAWQPLWYIINKKIMLTTQKLLLLCKTVAQSDIFDLIRINSYIFNLTS